MQVVSQANSGKVLPDRALPNIRTGFILILTLKGFSYMYEDGDKSGRYRGTDM